MASEYFLSGFYTAGTSGAFGANSVVFTSGVFTTWTVSGHEAAIGSSVSYSNSTVAQSASAAATAVGHNAYSSVRYIAEDAFIGLPSVRTKSPADFESVITTTTPSTSQHGSPDTKTYDEVEGALIELRNLEDEEHWKIEDVVFGTALQLAAVLTQGGFPAPSVFSHGSKSVVFNWCEADDNLYLTVTASKLFVLASSSEGISLRAEWGGAIEDAEPFLYALSSTRQRGLSKLRYVIAGPPHLGR
jgi:hypothetical protein